MSAEEEEEEEEENPTSVALWLLVSDKREVSEKSDMTCDLVLWI